MFTSELATIREAAAKILIGVILAITIPFAYDSVGICKREKLALWGIRDNRRIGFIPVVLPEADERAVLRNRTSTSIIRKGPVFRSWRVDSVICSR